MNGFVQQIIKKGKFKLRDQGLKRGKKMLSSKDYLQEKIGPCVSQLFEHYLPEENFKSVHDLFNVHKFYKLLMCILSEEVKIKLGDLNLHEQSQNQTYNEMRRRNFKRIYEIIEQSFYLLGQNLAKQISDKDISKMIENSDMKVMISFMEYLFDLLKHNSNIIQFITTLDETIQNNIMEVMENSQLNSPYEDELKIDSQHSIGSLKMLSKISPRNEQSHGMSQIEEMENHMQKMESHIQLKDDQLKEFKQIKEQLQEELQECRKELLHKNEEIQIFKKRIQSYEQIDQLLHQKDEEILKLTNKLVDQQLKARRRQSQLINQNKSLHQKLNEFDSKDAEISIKFEKQKSFIEQLNKQKDEAEISMKKVINNLKQKNKSLMDKLNDIQTQLTEVKFEKEMKEKQLNELKFNQNGKPVSSNFDDLSSPRTQSKQDINEGIQSMTGNYSRLGQQLSLQLDRADLQDEFGLVHKPTGNKRFNQLLQQNYSLRQQLQRLQSSGFADSNQAKKLNDEIQKLKKKINILNRRNDEIENKRKQEIDIMIGVIEQCSLQTFNKSK